MEISLITEMPLPTSSTSRLNALCLPAQPYAGAGHLDHHAPCPQSKTAVRPRTEPNHSSLVPFELATCPHFPCATHRCHALAAAPSSHPGSTSPRSTLPQTRTLATKQALPRAYKASPNLCLARALSRAPPRLPLLSQEPNSVAQSP